MKDAAAPAAIKPLPAPRQGVYSGVITHSRNAPVFHRLRRRGRYLMLDLDRLQETDATLKALAIDGKRRWFQPVAFRSSDVGLEGDTRSLRQQVEALLRAHGASEVPSQIMLLTMPRLWGYVFNPLSIYYCYFGAAGLGAVIYEVTNTFKRRHHYVLTADPRAPHAAEKAMYVSPFQATAGHYVFRLTDPGDTLTVVVDADDSAGGQVQAVLRAHWQPLTDRALAYFWGRGALMTRLVSVHIHLHAGRLWRKGLKIFKHSDRRGRMDSGALPHEETSQ